MTEAEKKLFAKFDALDIQHETIEHEPIMTVDDGKDFWHKIPGMNCKNLFMKDKKGQIWLIVMPGGKRAHINQLQKVIGAARMSFGKPELLLETLGIKPGSVTPFALINDISRHVKVVLDEDMLESDMVNYHPLRNTASTAIKSTDLLKFVRGLSYAPQIVNCGDWVED